MDLNIILNDNIELLYANFRQVDPHKVVCIDLVYYEWDYELEINMMAAIVDTPMVNVSGGNRENYEVIKQLFEAIYWPQVREICLLLSPCASYEEMRAFVLSLPELVKDKLLVLEVMNTDNIRFSEFIKRLVKEMEVTVDGSSSSEFPAAVAVLQELGNVDIKKSIAYFKEHGAYCDTEILYNIAVPLVEHLFLQ